MVGRKGVSVVVDENFFKTFEIERQREQKKLRRELGGMFNLTQRNFTAMLAANNFRFDIQKTNRKRKRRMIKPRSLK